MPPEVTSQPQEQLLNIKERKHELSEGQSNLVVTWYSGISSLPPDPHYQCTHVPSGLLFSSLLPVHVFLINHVTFYVKVLGALFQVHRASHPQPPLLQAMSRGGSQAQQG